MCMISGGREWEMIVYSVCKRVTLVPEESETMEEMEICRNARCRTEPSSAEQSRAASSQS